MTPGVWTNDDNGTWHCSCVFSFFWLITILVETSFRYKRNAMWNIVILATFVSLAKNVIIIRYSEMIRWHSNDPVKLAYGYELYKYFEFFQIFQHVLKCIGMFQRKRVVAPSLGFTDHAVLIFTTLIAVGASLFCLLAPGITCWGWSSPTLAISLLTTVGYFDFYYVYLIVRKFDNKHNQSTILQVLMPAIWTALNSIIYSICSLMYREGRAGFYSNSIWNFTSVLIPLVTIQSCISTNVGAFIQHQASRNSHSLVSHKNDVDTGVKPQSSKEL
ncbi:hypothetical protein BC833DRAFT_223130 [Globomyces pollinis-pini]|nr:hypothetical protein BC833DRAFT_223130 [Globomyces pollinis-pini]